MLEAVIQAEIVKTLMAKGYFCHSVPNEQSNGNPVRTGQLVSMGLHPGVADLVVWVSGGRVAYIEVKNEKGKQSDRQVAFQELCNRHGMPYKVVRSADEALAFVRSLI